MATFLVGEFILPGEKFLGLKMNSKGKLIDVFLTTFTY
jgi:hypothetical protein